jgi:hypothetical protein
MLFHSVLLYYISNIIKSDYRRLQSITIKSNLIIYFNMNMVNKLFEHGFKIGGNWFVS